MDKIDAQHYRILHQQRMIGDVSRGSDGRWLACLYGEAPDDLIFSTGQTRRGAVAALLSRERARWRYDEAGKLYRTEGEESAGT